MTICILKFVNLKEMRCTARATTICIGDQYIIRTLNANQYNPASQASKPEVLKTCTQIKKLAQISNDQPV